MDHNIVPILRAAGQQITVSRFSTAGSIASWMGAIQAQDFNMSKWAFGIRIRNSTEELINNEIDSGSIVRTHLLRPTWHFASSKDIRWIIDLTAPQIRAALKFRDKQLELTEKIYTKCNNILVKTLSERNHLTRDEVISELVGSGI